MTKVIYEFANLFGAKFALGAGDLIEKQGRFYLLSPQLRNLARRDFFCAGIYLGKIKGGRFFPSFPLLMMIASKAKNKITVNPRTEWLFICGRDIFRKGIIDISGSTKKGTHTLVLDEEGECLGFGTVTHDANEDAHGDLEVVKNVLDLGDFLRRER